MPLVGFTSKFGTSASICDLVAQIRHSDSTKSLVDICFRYKNNNAKVLILKEFLMESSPVLTRLLSNDAESLDMLDCRYIWAILTPELRRKLILQAEELCPSGSAADPEGAFL